MRALAAGQRCWKWVVVGGSTRVPLVRERVVVNSLAAPPLTAIDPDKVVAIGAAIRSRYHPGAATKPDSELLLDRRHSASARVGDETRPGGESDPA